MVLPLRSGMRFFRLFDLLCIYAHNRLHIVEDDEFFNDEPPRGISQEGERLTTDALWENVGIVDDYVRLNPNGLSSEDLQTVQSWTNAYTCIAYIARCDDDQVRFFVDDFAIDVCGMSQDIGKSLPKLPALAHTTLLPYDDYVVYDQMLEQLPLEPPQNMLDVFDEGLREAMSEGRVIRTGQEFCQTVPTLRKHKEEAQMEQFRHDLEMEERANGELEGQHRGVLAGLGGEEREEAIRDHMRETWSKSVGDEPRPAGRLKDCLAGEPVFGLRELVEAGYRHTYHNLRESAKTLVKAFEEHGERGKDGLSRALELQRTVEEREGQDLPIDEDVRWYQDPSALQGIVNDLVAPQIERMRKLADEGGYRTCADDPEPSPDEVPVSVDGLCYLFHTEGTYHVVMPREVVPLVRELDWDEAFAHERYTRRVAAFFECASDLRGIVDVDEAIGEFLKNFDDGSHSEDDVYATLIDAMEDEQVASVLLDTGDHEYLLHYELFAIYQEGRGKDRYTDDLVVEGPLTDDLRNLMSMQRGKEPRPVTEDMLEVGSVTLWKQMQPPAAALRTYLDEHVPDDADDYFFADAVIEDVLYDQMLGIAKGSVEAFFNTLDAHGFIPDESQVQKLLTLWQNLCNGLPTWPNNGWSPNEVMSNASGRRGGRRLFYNPDGSVMKVGRNDPCPCGSGKKYKRCCGR